MGFFSLFAVTASNGNVSGLGVYVFLFLLLWDNGGCEERSAFHFTFVDRGHSGRKMNYGEMRARLVYGFVEKANEMANAIAVLHDLLTETFWV